MRHIASVKRSDLIGLSIAFFATLVLGIELGIAVAVVASMLVVFARMSMPHTARLGRVAGTTSYRNLDRFPEAPTLDGIAVVRIDAAISFVNAVNVKRLLLSVTESEAESDPAVDVLVLDASGVNDLDATGAEMVNDVAAELAERGVDLHLADVKGPVRDVLRRAGIWDALGDRIHACTHEAVLAVAERRPAPSDQRRFGIDERGADHREAADQAARHRLAADHPHIPDILDSLANSEELTRS